MSISEDGAVATYNMTMECTLFLRMDQQAFHLQRSLRVTDGLFMSNSHRVVLATTARDLRFYHSATGTIVARLGLDSAAASTPLQHLFALLHSHSEPFLLSRLQWQGRDRD